MTTKNVAASVRARLATKAKATNRPFQELLQYYAIERFLYRLAASTSREQFVLKGALMLRVWDAPAARPTRDVDLLGAVDNSLDNLTRIVREICAVEVVPDGMVFDPRPASIPVRNTEAATLDWSDADRAIVFQAAGEQSETFTADATLATPTLAVENQRAVSLTNDALTARHGVDRANKPAPAPQKPAPQAPNCQLVGVGTDTCMCCCGHACTTCG